MGPIYHEREAKLIVIVELRIHLES